MRHGEFVAVILMCFAAAGCREGPHSSSVAAAHDEHSYSNPNEIRFRHADLDWNVLFDHKILRGRVIHHPIAVAAVDKIVGWPG